MAKEIAKLREMSIEELSKEEESLRLAVWKLRLQQSTGGPHRARDEDVA